ncbi:MAG: hypothetical protein K0Q77_1508 [Anaerosporomusa subterranea]|nr:hypothetical protein [Anaerosporomusa subterranea]
MLRHSCYLVNLIGIPSRTKLIESTYLYKNVMKGDTVCFIITVCQTDNMSSCAHRNMGILDTAGQPMITMDAAVISGTSVATATHIILILVNGAFHSSHILLVNRTCHQMGTVVTSIEIEQVEPKNS